MEVVLYIRVSGKPSKVPISICKEAVKFYGRLLLSNQLYHKISLSLEFKELSKYEYAYCQWEFENHKSRDFILTVNDKLTKPSTLMALAHEMVHVKQYSKGELKDYLKVNKSKWMGESYDLEKIDYWDQPWEIEAHGREKGLYYKFLDHMKEK